MKSCEQVVYSDFSNASQIENFRIVTDQATQRQRLEKRGAIELLHTFQLKLRGAVAVNEDNGEVIYVVSLNELYRVEYVNGAPSATELGTIPGATYGSDDEKVEMFRFAGKLYILGAGDYYVYDGSTISKVDGYVPVIRRKATYNSNGIEYERPNLLHNRVKMRFCPDGVNRRFYLYGLTSSIQSVTVNGEAVSFTPYVTSYRSSVELASLYAENEEDIIEVAYTLSRENRRDEIISNRHAAVYGGDTDSRVFLYGGENRATIYPSDLCDAVNFQTLSAEYFPEGAQITVGDGNLTVTGAVRQFDRLAIFTEEGAFYTYPNEVSTESGIKRFDFPVLPLNSDVGATKQGGAVLCENEPYALNRTGLYKFKSTSVRDERLAVRIEIPEFAGFTEEFILNCKLYVNRLHGELWCYYDGRMAIYNARIDCWYCYTGLDYDYIFDADGETIFMHDYTLYRLGNGCIDADGTVEGALYTAVYESGQLDFGNVYRHKTLYGFGVEFGSAGSDTEPDEVKLDCELITDRGDSVTVNLTHDNTNGGQSVHKLHSRLSRFSSLRFKLTAPAEEALARVNSVMLYYR